MLAYLPASGHPANPLFFRLQMNTGLRKWETTQKMRSASYPTPAELDAYAKKIANRPLSIQIYPNTVKVPQRKHIRRTVNGLDTSLLSQRHSPYLFSSNRGLLAVFRAPVKGVIKELDGSHIRQFHKVVMNPPGGMYRTQSTLNLSQPALHLQSPAQSMAQVAHKQNLLPPQTLQQQQQQSRAQPGALPQNISDSQPRHQVSLSHSEARQQDKAMMQAQTPQQQRLTHRQGTQSLCHTEVLLQQQQQQQRPCPPVRLQQHLFNLPTCKSQPSDQQLSFTQQAAHQDLHHIPDEAALLSLPPADELLCSQPPPQAACAPPKVGNGFQPQQAAAFEQRKPPDADVPPNVTVSTSTIPLSMASNLHQNHPGDLSSIVHQINQLCQARAGMGATSVCEGQIANPSPISRNLLINCLMVGHSDKALAQSSSGPLHPQPNVPATISIPTFQRESEKVHVQQQQQQQIQQHLHRHQQLQLQQLQQQQQQLQQQQQQQQQLQQQQQQQLQQQRQQQLQQQQVQRSWSRPQLSQEQDPPEGVHPCKNRRLEPSAECSFSSQNINYSNKLANTAHSLSLKRHLDKSRRSSSATCQLGSMPCTNGPLVQPLWAAAPGGHQDLPLGFQGAPVASSADGTVQGAAKYKDCTGQSKMMRKVDFFGRPVQVGGFQDHSTDVLENVQQGPAAGPVQTPGNVRILHTDHQGFC